MGVRAFQEGRSGAPAQDKDFHALLAEGEPDGTPYKHDGAMKVLTAFADAWMVEQRKASDEALRAEGFPLPRLYGNAGENPAGAGKAAEAKLKRLGIKNTADLDRWVQEHPQTIKKGPHKGEKSLMSRYGALKHLVGEQAADRMMQELMVQSWDVGLPKKRGR